MNPTSFRERGIERLSVDSERRRQATDRSEVAQGVRDLITSGLFEVAPGHAKICVENSEDEYIFCSHLPNIGDNLNGLRRVASHLKKFGELIFSVQGVHRDYEETLTQGVTYAQKITQLPDNCFDKCYIFSQEGEVTAEQFCKYRLFDEEEIRSILRDIGLEFKEITSCRQFHVYHKICELS